MHAPDGGLQPASTTTDELLVSLLPPMLLWLDQELPGTDPITPDSLGRVLARALGPAATLPVPEDRFRRFVGRLVGELHDTTDLLDRLFRRPLASEDEATLVLEVLERVDRLADAVRALAELSPAKFALIAAGERLLRS